MKIDRLLEIIIYLMNHDHVPASYLAEHYILYEKLVHMGNVRYIND